MESLEVLTSLLNDVPALPDVSVDWDALLQVALENKLLLPLSVALQNVAIRPRVPSEVQERLSLEATRRSLTEIHRAGRLVELMSALQEAGIEVKSFKGPALAQQAYGRVSARQCEDIDLLVREDDFPSALKLLLEAGFDYEMSDLPRCYTLFHYGVALGRGDQRLTVDLHKKLFSEGVSFDLAEFWASQATVDVQGSNISTFSPEQSFVYLALHGAKHCWSRLRWLYDLKQLRPRIRMSEVDRLAKRQRCRKAVGLALSLLELVWGEPIPPDFPPEKPEPALVSESLHYLKGKVPSWPAYHSYQRRVLDTRGQQLRLALYTWCAPQIHDLRFLDLPPRLWFVYYAIRPVRIVWEKLFR